jgi:hypothetical protein
MWGRNGIRKKQPIDEKAQQIFMDKWANWAEEYKESFIDFGAPLGNTKLVNSTGVSDKKNKWTAYSIVRAESHEQAASIFREHPHLSLHPGNAIEIIEMRSIPSMG